MKSGKSSKKPSSTDEPWIQSCKFSLGFFPLFPDSRKTFHLPKSIWGKLIIQVNFARMVSWMEFPGIKKQGKLQTKKWAQPCLATAPKNNMFHQLHLHPTFFCGILLLSKPFLGTPPSPKGMHEPYTGGAARGFYPPPSPTRKRTRKRTCDMCGSNSEGHDGGHIHHSSHHRQDIAKDQHVPLRTFKTGLGFVRCARVEINQLNQPLYILKGIRESLTGYIMKPYILL